MTGPPLDPEPADLSTSGRFPARLLPRVSVDHTCGPTVDELLDSAWQADASCLGSDPDAWFQDQGGVFPTTARRICARCPVRRECLAWALVFGEDHGIWGGLPPRRRRRLIMRLDAGVPLGQVLDSAHGATIAGDGVAA